MKRIFITIYILLVGTLFSVPFSLGPIVEGLFKDDLVQANRDIARGTFALIKDRLHRVGPERWQDELDLMQPLFGYPLSLLPLSEVDVEGKYRQEFLDGLIVEFGDEELLVMRMGRSDQAIVMGGPWPYKDLDRKITMLYVFLGVVLVTVPALAWTYFLIRDVRKIETTAARFISGDHDARVTVSRISSMTEITRAINAMAEKTQKLIASQKDLANSVSHEIRTPLARIKFSLEMAGEGETDTGGMDYLGEIARDVEEIEALVDEMLTYARFEREPEASGRLSNHEMVSWLTNLIRLEEKTAPGKEISFRPETDYFIARFEPVYLGWAVRNLLRNGVRHSKARVRLRFESGPLEACIHVDDDGPGISEGDREKIFQPFFRLDKSRSRASGGYGLGLAIAKRIITWHRGRVSAATSPWGGARFTLVLPLDPEGTAGREPADQV